MTPFVQTCPKFLKLLGDFYPPVMGQAPLHAELIVPEEVPQPYRRLLVHDRDMTSTLTDYYQEQIVLRVLDSKRAVGRLARHIVLESANSGLPVEYGASRIHLDVLSEEVCGEIVAARAPLGGILNAHGVAYTGCPGGFFRVAAGDLMMRVFGLHKPQPLYGRCNCLRLSSGAEIAEVVEILPPGADAMRSDVGTRKGGGADAENSVGKEQCSAEPLPEETEEPARQ